MHLCDEWIGRDSIGTMCVITLRADGHNDTKDRRITEVDMNEIYCQTCREKRGVVGFVRDDPQLSCGHVKQAKRDALDETRATVEGIFEREANRRGIDKEQVRVEYVQNLLDLFSMEETESTVGNCEICGTVTVIVGEDGIDRCGGNFLDNPGCGMPVERHYYHCHNK